VYLKQTNAMASGVLNLSLQRDGPPGVPDEESSYLRVVANPPTPSFQVETDEGVTARRE